MLKTWISALLLAGLCSAPLCNAANYLDNAAGYKVNLPEQTIQITGKNFLTIADTDKERKNLHIFFTLTPEDVQKLTGEKFTTAQFKQKYADLALLERTNVDSNKVNYKLFEAQTYNTAVKDTAEPTDAAASVVPLLPAGLLNEDYKLKTNKLGKNDFVLLELHTKADTEKKLSPMNVELALTSANDNLYGIISAFSEAPSTQETEEKAADTHSVFTKKKVAAAAKEAADAVTEGYLAERKNILTSFSTFQPQKNNQPFGFSDKISGFSVALPDDWLYTVIKDPQKNTNWNVTLAFPRSTVADYRGQLIQSDTRLALDKMPDWQGLSTNPTQDLTTSQAESMKDFFAKAFTQAVLVVSYQGDKNAFTSYLENAQLSELALNQVLKRLLENEKLQQSFNFKDYKYEVHLNERTGLVKLQGGILYQNKDQYENQSTITFNKNKFVLASYLSKKTQTAAALMEKIAALQLP